MRTVKEEKFRTHDGVELFYRYWPSTSPYLAGAWINSRLWTRGRPAANDVADGVWLGRMPTTAEFRQGSFRAVVDLAAEFPGPSGVPAYGTFPVLDLTIARRDTLIGAAHAIERMRTAGPVLVCCALGYSRSASAVAAWLLLTGRAQDAGSAAERVGRARPGVVFAPGHIARLGELKA